MTSRTEVPPPKEAEHDDVMVPDDRVRFEASRIPVYITLAVVSILWTIPSIGLLINSFREPGSIRAAGWWSIFGQFFDSATWTIENYEVVLDQGFGNAFANSLAVTLPSVVIPITVAAFAAYAFSWMEWPGRNILFALVVGLMVVPLQMAIVPIFRVYSAFELNGTFPAVWLAHAGFGLPLAVYLLRNYIGSLPSSLIESAKIDGAGHFGIFMRLVVPLSTPVLAAFAIFQFLWVWNDYLVALVFLGIANPDNAVLQVELANLAGRGEGALNLLPAAAFVTMLLPLVVFFALQRYFVRGMTAGAVKG